MKRREFITLLGGAAVTWPLAARAQPREPMRRIGVLLPNSSDDLSMQTGVAAFMQGLQEFGWSIGRNVRTVMVPLRSVARWRQSDDETE